MASQESPNPAATGAESVACSPNDKNQSQTLTPAQSPDPDPKIEPVLVSYLIDDSHLGMIKLLNAKKTGTLLLKDPTIDQRIYADTPWVLTQNRLPALPESQEHLFYSSRSLQVGSDTNIQRQLDGLGENDVLHYKRNNGVTKVYDPTSCEIVGRANYFTLKFSGYNDKDKDISTNWHLVEYESYEGDPMMTLCKLRLEDKAMKVARAEVKKMESKLKAAVLAADKEKSKLKVAELPDDNEFVLAVVQASDYLIAAELALDAAIDLVNSENMKNYEAIVGPRKVRAAAAAAAAAAPPDNDLPQWALGVGQHYTIISDATAVFADGPPTGEAKAQE